MLSGEVILKFRVHFKESQGKRNRIIKAVSQTNSVRKRQNLFLHLASRISFMTLVKNVNTLERADNSLSISFY